MLYKDFFQILQGVKDNLIQYAQFIKNIKKQDLLASFVEDIELISLEEYYVNDKIGIIEFKGVEGQIISGDSIRMNSRSIEFGKKGEWIWNSPTINIADMRLKDKYQIEQIYETIKGLLEEYLEKETKDNENAELFLERVKDKFSGQLIMNELKKKQ